eukprot:TRINITY_DN20594_c0_g1_i2.p1 TRINITY_DN20594_c0_g1~~TRINITY_DN20594_c0_g1_i2.p1  ORF type:complete len:122 (-),score=32.73 TRINITY_DN20594_c0_g1_i2:29-394(-)
MRSWPILFSYPPMPSLPMDHWPNVVSLLMSRAGTAERGVQGFYDKRARHSYLTEALDEVSFVFSVAIFRSNRSLSNERPLLARFTHLGSLIRRDHAFMPFPECVDGVPLDHLKGRATTSPR